MAKRKSWLLNLVVFLTAAIAAFALTKLLVGPKKWQITYDDSLSKEQQDFLAQALADYNITSNLSFSATTLPQLDTAPTSLTYRVLVPVTDFYSPISSITTAELSASGVTLTDINNLTPTQKLLALDGDYYLDTFTSGAQFETILVQGSTAEEVATHLRTQLATTPNKSNTLSYAQTGVTALTRGMNSQLSVTAGDFSQFLADFLANKDLTHISNEVSFTDDCAVESGSLTLCADWQMLSTITAIGTDIVELTGNHNNDYGAAANVATIDRYHELGLQTFGGGIDEEAARQPLQLNYKNAQITQLGYNYSTTTASYGGANGDIAGANLYDEEQAASDIAAAKARGDFVIVDVQYFECYAYPVDGGEYPDCDAPIDGQTEFSRHLIDLGADIVVGTSAHQPQTYELYQGKPIYYGLGNLFFDQIYWPGTTRGLILTHYFVNGRYVQTRLSPTAYDEAYQTKLLNEEESTWMLNRLNQARP